MRSLWMGAAVLALLQAPTLLGMMSSLDTLRDKARPLLIFTAHERDARFARQTTTLAVNADGLIVRQIIGIGLPARGDEVGLDTRIWLNPSPQMIADERRLLHISPDDFVVILIGKDGGEKKRWTHPVTFDELRAVVDAMPGRQEEIRHPQPQQ